MIAAVAMVKTMSRFVLVVHMFATFCLFAASLFLLVFPSSTPAQQLLFEHISYEQGLSDASVTAILQDSRGFLWIGTSNGLNRYDGYNFITERNDPTNPLSLGNNTITVLYEDANAMLWVGTQNGLFRYDRTTGAFRVYKSTPDSVSANSTRNNSLSNNVIRSIAESPDGMLWVGTKRGLNMLDVARNEWTLFKADKKGRGKGPSDNEITALCPDRTNRSVLWLGTRDGSINELHLPSKKFTVYKPDENKDEAMMLTDNGITALAQDSHGMVWTGTRSNGVMMLNPENGTFTYFRDICTPQKKSMRLANSSSSSSNDIRIPAVQGLCIDKSGNIWVGSRTGAIMFNPVTGERTEHTSNPNDLQSLSDNDINALYADRSGVLWIGTQNGGMNKYVPKTSYFRVFKVTSDEPNGLQSPVVNVLTESIPASVLLGGQNTVQSFYNGRFATIFTMPEANITAILQNTRDGATWIGTETGLMRIDRASNRTLFRANADDKGSLSDDAITALVQDRAGNVWIGTQGGGVNRFDARTGTFSVFRNDPDAARSLSDNFVFSLLIDHAGMLWAGTSNGLNRLNTATGECTRFMRSETMMLPEVPILALHEDGGGALWLGTLGGSLFKFTPGTSSNTGKAIRFSKKDGLPSETIYGILPDGHGNLWMSTSRGLAVMSISPSQVSARIRVYTKADGLQSDAFRKGAFLRTADGTMYFGVGTGFVQFHPDSLRDNPVPPRVGITSLHVFGGMTDPFVNERGEHTLDLRFGENFEVQFAALDFTNSASNEYAYKFDEVHKDWIYIGQNHSVIATGLDPGDYTLRVKAANSDGVWNETGAVLRISILPPWYMTLWFRISVGLTVVGLVFVALRSRMRNMQMMNTRLQELVEVRTKEITEQTQLLESQAEEIQSANGALQEKNIELGRILGQSESARQELQHAYALLDTENARKTQELDEARTFQLSMLPAAVPQFEGLDIAFAMRTATEVGGDYYDYVIGADGSITLAIGDATGHGVRAGMLVSLVKSSFHALVHTNTLDEIATAISRSIKQMRLQRMFMCLSLIRLQRTAECSMTLQFAGAGMPPILLFRAQTRTLERFRTQGIVLGATYDAVYTVHEFTVRCGDTLLLMSDGLTELFNADSEELGTHEVENVFVEAMSAPEVRSEHILTALDTLADNWLRGETQNDDIALMVIRVE
jgi:ligand-binding sensor domain-containing protein